jgi:hypothetical protein
MYRAYIQGMTSLALTVWHAQYIVNNTKQYRDQHIFLYLVYTNISSQSGKRFQTFLLTRKCPANRAVKDTYTCQFGHQYFNVMLKLASYTCSNILMYLVYWYVVLTGMATSTTHLLFLFIFPNKRGAIVLHSVTYVRPYVRHTFCFRSISRKPLDRF